MRKCIIISLIVVVIATMVFFVNPELSVNEIFYVNDYESEVVDNRYSVKRLYSSDINIDEFNEQIEKLISLEFTEDDIMRAALDAGTPELYPAFHIYAHRRKEDEYLELNISAVQELAENQKSMNFTLENIRLEIVTNGVTIKESTSHSGKWDGTTEVSQPIINEGRNGMAVSLGNFGDSTLILEGTSGTVVLQFSYDVRSQTLFPQSIMTDCFLRMDANLSLDKNGDIVLTCSKNAATTVDEYIEQE